MQAGGDGGETGCVDGAQGVRHVLFGDALVHEDEDEGIHGLLVAGLGVVVDAVPLRDQRGPHVEAGGLVRGTGEGEELVVRPQGVGRKGHQLLLELEEGATQVRLQGVLVPGGDSSPQKGRVAGGHGRGWRASGSHSKSFQCGAHGAR